MAAACSFVVRAKRMDAACSFVVRANEWMLPVALLFVLDGSGTQEETWDFQRRLASTVVERMEVNMTRYVKIKL